MKRHLGNLLALGIAFLFCVVLVELLGQHVLFKDKLYFVRDVDHRMKPYAEDTNGDGVRSEREAELHREEDLNVIFLGDSFVFGAGVERDDAIPQQFERIARERSGVRTQEVKAANFGWISASPLLCYRQLKEIGRKYRPDVVVLCVDMTDFLDDVKYRRLLDRQGVFRLVGGLPVTIMGLHKAMTLTPALAGLHERAFGFPAERFFISDRPLAKSARYLPYIRSSIDSIDAYCGRELGARFVLAVLPRSYQYSDRESPNSWEKGEYEPLGPFALEPFRYFDGLRAEVDYPVHSLLRDFQTTSVFPTCLDADPHWNADGNRVAAEAIYRCLVDDGLVEDPSR